MPPALHLLGKGSRTSRRALAVALVAAPALVALGLSRGVGAGTGSTRWVSARFRGPGGVRESIVVAMPAWYGPGRDPPLPLVVSPHSRGLTPRRSARRWGAVPGRFGIIVVNAGLHGRVIPRRSWAWPPEIGELARLPQIARRLFPYLRYDPRRVYAVGDSMGGQETLMLLARRPDLFAAAAAADPVTNLGRRWYQFPVSQHSRREQLATTREVGATPRQAPWLYARRSPSTFARTIAFSGVPLQLWWNPHDAVVIREGTTQAGSLYAAIRRLNPDAPVFARVDGDVHGWVFKHDHELPAIVRFLLAHRRHGPPAAGFAYASWLPRATVWDWRFRARGVGHGLWAVWGVTSCGFTSDAPGPLSVRPPTEPSSVALDGSPLRGSRDVAVPPGRHDVALGARGCPVRGGYGLARAPKSAVTTTAGSPR